MAATSTEFKRGTRIVLTDDIPGVPEGTGGKVGRAVGFTLTRYRVRFDNAVDATSVAADKLVRAADWDSFRTEREAAREAAASAAAAAAPAAAPPPPAEAASDDAGGQDPRLAALMAKSKAAKAAKGIETPDEPAPAPAPAPAAEPEVAAPAPAPAPAPAAAEPAASSGEVDPRLAALTEKSRAARKAAGVDVDAEVAAPAAPAEAPAEPAPAAAAPPPDPEPEPDTGPALPEGYFPADNRVADLLSRIKSGDVAQP